jgi:hypothetical protein
MQWIHSDGPNCGRWFSDNDYTTNNLVINCNYGQQQQQISASPSELANKFDIWYCPSCVPYYGIGTYKSSKRPGLRKRSRPIDFYTKLNDPGGNIGNSTTISVSNNYNDDNCNYGSLLSAIIMSSNQDTPAINVDFEKLLQTKRRTNTSGGGSYFVTDTIEMICSSSASDGVDDTEEFDTTVIFAKHGYNRPLLFDTSITPQMLGMILPPQPFGYENVCQLVGPYRPIQVTDVATQRTVDCTLKEFVNYLLHYDENTTSATRKEIKQGISGSKQKRRTRIINSITLEVSKTPLGELVREPKFARDVDLVELHWPRSVEEIIHGRSTNSCQRCSCSEVEEKVSLSSIPPTTLSSLPTSSCSLPTLSQEEMNQKLIDEGSVNNNIQNELEYTTIITEKPHVTKYCLMSAAGSYTDFHVDFGGTSVWYHVYTGTKIFYFIEPTVTNINIYTNWATNKKHDKTKKKVGAATTSVTEKYFFLPDLIHAAGGVVHEVQVQQGQTLFIPSGWFHAVYTPIDSLVFGGNFLHHQSLDMQLQVHKLENVMKVGPEFRFPYFQRLLWYTARDFIMECTELINRTVISTEEGKEEEKVLMTAVNSSHPIDQIAKMELDDHHVRILCMTYPSHVLRGYNVLAKELTRWSNSRIKSTIEQYPVHIDVVAVASELGSMMRLCIAHLDKKK